MPDCRGITAHVTDREGRSLPEWGVQRLKLSQSTRRASAFVESTTDANFRISVQPRIPWCDADNEVSDNPEVCPPRLLHARLEAQRKARKTGVPPYAFIATVFIDGREEPERSVIIYLDPGNTDFNAPDGKVVISSRYMQTKDGRVAIHEWAFKERTIESVFDKLIIDSQQNDIEEDILVTRLQTSGLNAAYEDLHKHKVGQILVEARRVKLGPEVQKQFVPKLMETNDNLKMGDIEENLTHMTGLVRRGRLSSSEAKYMKQVEYQPWKPTEGVYASFLFFYRSREQLVNFGFPGFPSPPKAPRRDRRSLDKRLAYLDPVSISKQAESSFRRVKGKGESFEDKIENRKRPRLPVDAEIATQSKKILKTQLRGFYNTGILFTSIAAHENGGTKPTSKTTELPSHALSKEHLEKLGARRYSLRSQAGLLLNPLNIDDNEEDDADISEPATESDLESLVDDNFPTHPGAAEDEESRKLRKQLKAFRIMNAEHGEVDTRTDEEIEEHKRKGLEPSKKFKTIDVKKRMNDEPDRRMPEEIGNEALLAAMNRGLMPKVEYLKLVYGEEEAARMIQEETKAKVGKSRITKPKQIAKEPRAEAEKSLEAMEKDHFPQKRQLKAAPRVEEVKEVVEKRSTVEFEEDKKVRNRKVGNPVGRLRYAKEMKKKEKRREMMVGNEEGV